MTWAHHQGSLCQYFYTHIAQISKVACAVIFLCIHRTYTHVHTCTHSYICFVHQGASSFYDKRKVGVQIFTCYFHLLLETGNRKPHLFMEWKGPALSMMKWIMTLTECSLYSPLKKHGLSAEAGVIGRRAGCSTQI